MKTPMQELLEWVRTTLPMGLDTSRMIEAKIESMLEMEKEQIVDAHIEGQRVFDDYLLAWFNDGYWFEQETEQIVNVKYWAKLPVAPYE